MAGEVDEIRVIEAEIPDHWERATFRQLLKDGSLELIQDGNHGGAYPKAEEFEPSGIPLITGADLNDGVIDLRGCKFLNAASAKRLRIGFAKTGDVLLTHKGTMGKTAIVPSLHWPYIILNPQLTLYRVSTSGRLNNRFLKFFFDGKPFQEFLERISGISTISTLSLSVQKTLELPVPPLAEQKAIAAVLGALDDKIELNRRMNTTLEAMARALFQSWFVDFDPVRAKLDGRKPVGMDEATAALFPEHFEHGEHEMLPVGWTHAAIEEVCAINTWTLGKNDDFETLEYVEISEVSRGDIANIATYTRGEEPSRARRRLRHGDTVLSTVRPDRGSYFLALNPPQNRVASTGFAVFTPTKAPWSFLHAALTQQEVSDHLGQMADGGAYPAVRPEIIGAMKVAVPNEPKILEAFHCTCAPLLEQAEANRTQSRTLAILGDTLLPKLLSGELSVDTLKYQKALDLSSK